MFSSGFFPCIKSIIFENHEFKFPATFLKDGKLFLTEIFVPLIVGVTQVFSNDRVLVLLNALRKVPASITNTIRITQMTFEFVDNALVLDLLTLV